MKLNFLNKNKNPTKKVEEAPNPKIDMITQTTTGFYMWNGDLYDSDIIRSCIRPKVNAIGKLTPKHIKDDGKTIKINEDAYMKFLLEEPNKLMTYQVMMEKVVTQFQLNSNAFIAIHRNVDGIPVELMPIDCVTVNAKYDKLANLFLEFILTNGNTVIYSYSDIIHLRKDFNSNSIFGDSPVDVLKPLMNIVITTDQGIVGAIKNSSIIRWLLEFKQSLRPEDIKKEVRAFVSNFLDIDTSEGGAIGVDPKYTAKQVEPKDYVPNASQMDKTTQRLFSFFNTNLKIIQSNYTEDEWNAYYEAEIEPFQIQASQEYARKILSRQKRFEGENIILEAANLQYASMSTKLGLVHMVDRGAMPPNEWRKILNLPPIEGGDKPIRRLDTAVVKGGETE